MESSTPPRASDEARILARTLVEELAYCRVDQAQSLYDELCALEPRARDLLIFPLMIAVQRNAVPAFYQTLQDKGDDFHPELQVMCLQYMGDPTWEGRASELVGSHPDPLARRSMRYLMGDLEAVE